MNSVRIKGKDYRIKFTIGFWKRIQVECGITKESLQEKISQNYGETIQNVIFYGIYYGLPEKPQSINDMPISMDDIDDVETTVLDVIEQEIIDGMTKAERETVDKVKEMKQKKIQEFFEQESGPVKKN